MSSMSPSISWKRASSPAKNTSIGSSLSSTNLVVGYLVSSGVPHAVALFAKSSLRSNWSLTNFSLGYAVSVGVT